MEIVSPIKGKSHGIVPFGLSFEGDIVKGGYYKLFNNMHPGIDYNVPIGTEVFSSFQGIVVRKEKHIGMGNVLGIRNGNIVALYAHMSKIYFSLGDIVNKGIVIGETGDTGNACPEPHLHFELRDLTKGSLAEMVFEPVFNSKLTNYVEEFEYIVNNKNTKKNLRVLSLLFFGSEKYVSLLAKKNSLDIGINETLKDGAEIMISNFY